MRHQLAAMLLIAGMAGCSSVSEGLKSDSQLGADYVASHDCKMEAHHPATSRVHHGEVIVSPAWGEYYCDGIDQPLWIDDVDMKSPPSALGGTK